MPRPLTHILYLLLFVTWIGVCASSIYYIKTTPDVTSPYTVVSASTFVPTVPSTPELIQRVQAIPEPGDASWSLLRPGLERRVLRIYNDQNGLAESVYIWRLDQKHFRMDIAYDNRPKSLETWQAETNAALVVNGGYYSIENERYFPDGLTIANGEPFGRSFNGFGGMLAIKDAWAELRWLVPKPYNASEPLQAALQSFPVLVEPGGSFTYEFDAEPFGTHLYHCHAVPLKRHIHKGLYGAFIVDPDPERHPLEREAAESRLLGSPANQRWQEIVLVMNGFDTNFDDEAATPIASGSPPFRGSFRPSSPLSVRGSHSCSWRSLLSTTV